MSALVSVENVSVRYSGTWPTASASHLALDDVSLAIDRGEIFGLVGESGSGKSTLARVILKLMRPVAGCVRIDGRDVRGFSGRESLAFRRRVQVVFQDSLAALDPRMRVGASVREALDLHGIAAPNRRATAIAELFERVGLDEGLVTRFPHQLSGGQRQRVAIARAISVSPEILIADEPVSALDLSVQAQVLALLTSLSRERGMTMLFISHDLGVVRRIARHVAVLQNGRVMETGATDTVFDQPKSAYTRMLVDSVPRVDFDKLASIHDAKSRGIVQSGKFMAAATAGDSACLAETT